MYNHTPRTSTLASLRALIPRCALSFDEALSVAERQAIKLAEILRDPNGIQEHHLAELPRITIDYAELPVSGMSHWNGQQWVITINKNDPLVRQRFTLLHEFKHIIDHGATTRLYSDTKAATATQQAERAADYFAGCALVGRRELKAAWGQGMQREEDLATHFGVSIPAIQVRLAQTGLDRTEDHVPAPRCARPISTPSGRRQRFSTIHTRYARRSYA